LDANNNVIYTLQNTGNYFGNSLQTFQIPYIDMSQVVSTKISSTSTVNPTANVYGIKSSGSNNKYLLYNITYSLMPLELFNNTATNAMNVMDITVPLKKNVSINYVVYQNSLPLNYKPFYVIIPSIKLNYPQGTTVPALQFSFSLSSGSKVYVTTTFSISSSYPNGITIPLQTPQPSQTTSGIAFTVTTPTTNAAPYLSSNANITGTLTYIGTTSYNSISVTTLVNLDSGMIVNLYGTLFTIDPTLTPSTMTIASPITYSSNKVVSFTAPTNTSATNASISYTIYPSTIVAMPSSAETKIKLNSNAVGGDTVVYANSPQSNGYNPMSIFAKTTIKNYATLQTGKVVPFVNTYTPSTGESIRDMSTGGVSYMYINFTQNVTLDALDFGYILSVFLPSTGINNAGYTATGASSTFSLTITNANSTEALKSYGTVTFNAIPNTYGSKYNALYTSANNSSGSNDGSLMTIPFIVSAAATATVSGGVIAYTITNPGYGYTSAPLVTVSGLPNTAVAVATISAAGSVTGITFTSGNTGYLVAPSITFSVQSNSLASSVSSFSPAAVGSKFAFNVGDEICIAMTFPAVSSYWTTPTTGLGVQTTLAKTMGEMCGSLICTPNTTGNPTYNPTPSTIEFTLPNVVTNGVGLTTVQSSTMNIDGKTILTGFQFVGISIVPTTPNTPEYPTASPMPMRADIYKNSAVIFQVFFNFTETSASLTPLYIPFSYTEYDRVNSIQSSLVSRINPTSMYFNQPQNPIFNANDNFYVKIVSGSSSSIKIGVRQTSVDGTNYAAGALFGIVEALPTYTFLAQNAPITPIFSMSTTKMVTISKPTSNSNGNFAYIANGGASAST
jgi:hypothetical protein